MKKMKILLSIIVVFFIMLLLPVLYFSSDKDSCLDMSICKEGLEINTEYGLIKVNKENCLKYNWEWDEKLKLCDMRGD